MGCPGTGVGVKKMTPTPGFSGAGVGVDTGSWGGFPPKPRKTAPTRQKPPIFVLNTRQKCNKTYFQIFGRCHGVAVDTEVLVSVSVSTPQNPGVGHPYLSVTFETQLLPKQSTEQNATFQFGREI